MNQTPKNTCLYNWILDYKAKCKDSSKITLPGWYKDNLAVVKQFCKDCNYSYTIKDYDVVSFVVLNSKD